MKLSYKGKELFTRTATTWWLTAFKFQLKKAKSSDLNMKVWIKFNSKGQRDAFAKELKNGIKKKAIKCIKEWKSYYDKGYKVYFRW